MAKAKSKNKVPKRNLIALDLRTPKYRKRIEKNKKGKGSYNRQKNISDDFFISFTLL